MGQKYQTFRFAHVLWQKNFTYYFQLICDDMYLTFCHRYGQFLRETPLATNPISYNIIQLQQNILIHAVRNQVHLFKKSFAYKLYGNGILRFAEKGVIDSSARIS